MNEFSKIDEIRQALPAVLRQVFLNTGTNGPLPIACTEAMHAWNQRELEAGRVGETNYEQMQKVQTELRELLGKVVHYPPERLVLVPSTTAGISAALNDYNWSPGDEILATDGEHGGVLIPAAYLERRFGVRAVLVPIGRKGGDITGEFAALRTPRTKLVAVSHVSWSTGALYDVAALTRWAHAEGLPVVIDGAQSAGAIPVDIGAIGAEYYSFPGQKWLCGPTAVGAMAVSADRMPKPGDWPAEHRTLVKYDDHPWIEGTRRFEAVNKLNPAALAGMRASLQFLLNQVGLDWAYERAHRLTSRALDLLRGIPGVDVLTPEQHGTLACFRVEGYDQTVLLERLTAAGFRPRVVPDSDCLRFSCGFYNTEDEIDRAVGMIAEFAASAPVAGA